MVFLWEEIRCRETQGENSMWWWRQRFYWWVNKPRNTKGVWKLQKLREGHGADSPLEPSERAWPYRCLMFGLLGFLSNSQKTHFDCFKPPSLQLSAQPWEANTANHALLLIALCKCLVFLNEMVTSVKAGSSYLSLLIHPVIPSAYYPSPDPKRLAHRYNRNQARHCNH